ncbi:MAG TPA: 5'-nucleotidase C-terminal domain-containing protein [Anaeromyxobacteraceae bacterium]|nr:5'-nucleotidase C-terminal domain-containing protein [Anaeromyxobacteraceae bacterium]
MLTTLAVIALAAAPRCVEVLSVAGLHGRTEALPRLAAEVEAARAEGDALVVAAGDVLFGTAEADFTEGQAVAAGLEALGVSAAAVGDQEFGQGWETLRARVAGTRFPWLAANLKEAGTGALPRWKNLRSGSIVTMPSGLAVGIVGIAPAEGRALVPPGRVRGLEFGDEAPAAAVAARTLRRDGADLVLVVAHVGASCPEGARDPAACQDSALFRLAQELGDAVDGIVAGHSHRSLALEVGGVPVVQAPGKGERLARLTLCEKGGAGQVAAREPTPGAGGDAPDGGSGRGGDRPAAAYRRGVLPATVEAAVGPFVAMARIEAERELGASLEAPLAREAPSGGARSLGVAAAAALRRAGGASFGVVPAAALRADLPAGKVTAGALREAFPAPDRLVVAAVEGWEVEALVRAAGAGGGGGPAEASFAGLAVGADGTVTGCDGAPLEARKVYRLAASEDASAGAGEVARALAALPPERVELVGGTTREAVAAWLRSAPGGRVAEGCP